ncbi:MAG: NHL repeat-containing protein [Deltaproteobacteria bacterium]|nr:NHL repeat-containing protein [Deltaproteobacteria bacterium]
MEMKRVRGLSGRFRFIVFLLVAVVVPAVLALRHWGVAWTLAAREGSPARYSLVGFWDGADVPSGEFFRPIGIAVAPNGDVFVTDARLRFVRLGPSGEFKGEWGHEGKGPGGFGNPMGIAVARDDSVFVSDYEHDRIHKFTPDGRFLLSFGGPGKGPGRLTAPAGLAVDPSGSLYVADFYNHRVQKFEADGSFKKIIGHPGRMGAGALHYPTGVTVAPDGKLLVADAYNHQLQWFDPGGIPVRRAGYRLFLFWPRAASSRRGFKVPTGAAAGPDGLLHVADSGNHRIVMLTAEGRYVTDWVLPDANPGVYSPEQIAVSTDGRTVYATDLASNRILVLKVGR